MVITRGGAPENQSPVGSQLARTDSGRAGRLLRFDGRRRAWDGLRPDLLQHPAQQRRQSGRGVDDREPGQDRDRVRGGRVSLAFRQHRSPARPQAGDTRCDRRPDRDDGPCQRRRRRHPAHPRHLVDARRAPNPVSIQPRPPGESRPTADGARVGLRSSTNAASRSPPPRVESRTGSWARGGPSSHRSSCTADSRHATRSDRSTPRKSRSRSSRRCPCSLRWAAKDWSSVSYSPCSPGESCPPLAAYVVRFIPPRILGLAVAGLLLLTQSRGSRPGSISRRRSLDRVHDHPVRRDPRHVQTAARARLAPTRSSGFEQLTLSALSATAGRTRARRPSSSSPGRTRNARACRLREGRRP